MKDQTKIIVALLAGAAVGAAVSLLLAPSTGTELREDIADYVDDIINVARSKAEETASNLRNYGNSTMERSKSTFRSAVNDLSDLKDDTFGSAKSKANDVASAAKSRVKSGAEDLKDSI